VLAIKAEIRRYVDDSFSGWVECAFVDAAREEQVVVEKVPIVTTESLSRESDYPRSCEIACTLLSEPRRTSRCSRQGGHYGFSRHSSFPPALLLNLVVRREEGGG